MKKANQDSNSRLPLEYITDIVATWHKQLAKREENFLARLCCFAL